MSTIYVVITRAARVGSPAVGWDKEEIPIPMPDKSYDLMRAAEAKAISQWSKKHGLSENQAYVFGLF